MFKLLSSAALGLSVIVALTTAPVHANNLNFGFGISNLEYGYKQQVHTPRSHGRVRHVDRRYRGFFLPSRQRGSVYRAQRQSFIIGPTQRRHNRHWYRR